MTDRAIDMRRKSVEAFAELFPNGSSLRGAFLAAVDEWARAMELEASQRAIALVDLGHACDAIAEVRRDRAQ